VTGEADGSVLFLALTRLEFGFGIFNYFAIQDLNVFLYNFRKYQRRGAIMNRGTRGISKRSLSLRYAIHPLVLCLHLSPIDNPKPVLSECEGSLVTESLYSPARAVRGESYDRFVLPPEG
jgi:hypothetical protein